MTSNIKVQHMEGAQASTPTGKPKRPKPLSSDDLDFLYNAGWAYNISKKRFGKNQVKACELRAKIMSRVQEHISYRRYMEDKR